MALPKINQTKYKVFLYGLNEEVEYRAFTVREQKILLEAKEVKGDGAEQAIVNAMMQVIEGCTFGLVDVEQLSIFDFETLFIKIRCKSVSEISEITYEYSYYETEEDELSGDKTKMKGDTVTVNVNLNDLIVDVPENHSKVIPISDDVGIQMKYPTIKDLSKTKSFDDQIKSCIESVYDSNGVYSFADETDEEINEFLESLDINVLVKINEFFETIPRIRHEEVVTLKNGKQETIVYEGIDDFFV